MVIMLTVSAMVPWPTMLSTTTLSAQAVTATAGLANLRAFADMREGAVCASRQLQLGPYL